MPVQQRQNPSYLLAICFVVGMVLVAAIIFGSLYVMQPKEIGAIFAHGPGKVQTITVVNRDKTFEIMKRTGDSGPISVVHGSWKTADESELTRLMIPNQDPRDYIVFESPDMVTTLTPKSSFMRIDAVMRKRIEEWRQAAPAQ